MGPRDFIRLLMISGLGFFEACQNPAPPAGLQITPDPITLKVGDSQILLAEFTEKNTLGQTLPPQDVTASTVFASRDSAVCIVSKNTAAGKGPGTTSVVGYYVVNRDTIDSDEVSVTVIP